MSTIDWYISTIKVGTLTIANTTATKLFDLPKDSRIVGIHVRTVAASAGATLDVGISGNTDKYVDGLDVSAAGSADGSLLESDWLSAATVIYGLIGGAPVAGGGFEVVCTYINRKHTRLP